MLLVSKLLLGPMLLLLSFKDGNSQYLCFSMTTNKSQGQTLNKVGLSIVECDRFNSEIPLS